MDNTLNNYIDRANEIISLKNKNRWHLECKKQKYQNEFMTMIKNLEDVLKVVKEKYGKFNTVVGKTDTNIVTFQQELNRYKIEINNLTLYGNIGNIYDKKIILNDKIPVNQVQPCFKKNECRNILGMHYCKFWHDPADLLELKNNHIITDEYYERTIKYIRNFANTSWIYSSTFNKNVRCIGSKYSLENDVKLIKLSEDYKLQVENMKAQVAHDLLVLLYLNERGLA